MLMAQALTHGGQGRWPSSRTASTSLSRDLLTSAGLRTPPHYADERGARTDDPARLRGLGAVLIHTRASVSDGAALRQDRRTAALDWARATGGLIVGDDYDYPITMS